MPQHSARFFKSGWLPDLPDHRDIRYSAPIDVVRSLSASIDLRPECPPVFDQGKLASCAACAAGAAFLFGQRKQQMTGFDPSRLFIYYNARADAWYDGGAHVRDTIKTMNAAGVCAEECHPYDEARYAERPTDDCYASAQEHQVLRYYRLEGTQLTELRACLAEGYPFIFGFTVWDSYLTTTSDGLLHMPGANEQSYGGHVAMAVGYDDSRQVFIIQNSEGTGWGDKGYGYMPYCFITNPGCADDFWTIRLVESAEV